MTKLDSRPETAGLRPVRSFVRREGRLTAGQRRALTELLPRWEIAVDGPELDWKQIFGRRALRVLEIGFGNGEALAAMAADHPGTDFIGVEVYRPGIGRLLQRLAGEAITNVRVAPGDATEFLGRRVGPGTIDRIQVFFPDPWPKKRHRKRRLVQGEFVDLMASRLGPGGTLHIATDWQDYAEHMLGELEACPILRNAAEGFAQGPAGRPVTRFERRGQARGHRVYDIIFYRSCEKGRKSIG